MTLTAKIAKTEHRKTEEPISGTIRAMLKKILQEIKTLQTWIDLWKSVNKKAEEADELIQHLQMDDDETLYDEINSELDKLGKAIEDAEFKNMLSGKDDNKNCILTIHSGAGGTNLGLG